MIPPISYVLVAAFSSLVAVNGAVFRRDVNVPSVPVPAASSTTATTSSQALSTTTTLSINSTTSIAPASTTTQSPSVGLTASTTTTSLSVTASPPKSSSSSVTTAPSSIYTAATTTNDPPKTWPPVTTTPTTPPGTSGTANCNGVQQWQASFAYTAGNQVIYNGQLFTALQWTYANAPSAHPDQWSAGGTCAQPTNNQANCKGVVAWQRNVAYVAGNQVTYNGHLWAAVQWTQSNTPGDTSGSWKDLGACA